MNRYIIYNRYFDDYLSDAISYSDSLEKKTPMRWKFLADKLTPERNVLYMSKDEAEIIMNYLITTSEEDDEKDVMILSEEEFLIKEIIT